MLVERSVWAKSDSRDLRHPWRKNETDRAYLARIPREDALSGVVGDGEGGGSGGKAPPSEKRTESGSVRSNEIPTTRPPPRMAAGEGASDSGAGERVGSTGAAVGAETVPKRTFGVLSRRGQATAPARTR